MVNKKVVKSVDGELSSAEVPELIETDNANKSKFITINTTNVKGIRLNIDTIKSYAPTNSTETSIHVAYIDGSSTNLNFNSKELMYQVLSQLDERCL